MTPNPAAKVDTGPQVYAIGHKELEHQAIHYSYLALRASQALTLPFHFVLIFVQAPLKPHQLLS